MTDAATFYVWGGLGWERVSANVPLVELSFLCLFGWVCWEIFNAYR